jgi:hypothetical protein
MITTGVLDTSHDAVLDIDEVMATSFMSNGQSAIGWSTSLALARRPCRTRGTSRTTPGSL